MVCFLNIRPSTSDDLPWVAGVDSTVGKLQTRGLKDYACGLDNEGLERVAQLLREQAIQRLGDAMAEQYDGEEPIQAVQQLNKLLTSSSEDADESEHTGSRAEYKAFVDNLELRACVLNGEIKLAVPIHGKSRNACAQIIRNPSNWPERFRRGRE